MTITSFNPEKDLIIVRSRIWGRRTGPRRLSLAVDTASAGTVISPCVVEAIGYHPRDGGSITTVRSAIGKEQGYTLNVARFTALGYSFSDFEVHVFDLAAGYDIDGLIGLSFLRRFDYAVRSIAGRLLVQPAVADAAPV